MVKFKQINRFQYLAEEHEELVDYVKKTLEELSGSSKDFIEQSNRELFHYTTSVGIMPDPEDGIRVKYVDSYYIR